MKSPTIYKTIIEQCTFLSPCGSADASIMVSTLPPSGGRKENMQKYLYSTVTQLFMGYACKYI